MNSCNAIGKKHNKKWTEKKWTENLKRYISIEDIQIANRCMETHSTLLIIRALETKTTMRYDRTSCLSERLLSNDKKE